MEHWSEVVTHRAIVCPSARMTTSAGMPRTSLKLVIATLHPHAIVRRSQAMPRQSLTTRRVLPWLMAVILLVQLARRRQPLQRQRHPHPRRPLQRQRHPHPLQPLQPQRQRRSFQQMLYMRLTVRECMTLALVLLGGVVMMEMLSRWAHEGDTSWLIPSVASRRKLLWLTMEE